jgi:formylglycine-generating enzyme required for sulfatase activity
MTMRLCFPLLLLMFGASVCAADDMAVDNRAVESFRDCETCPELVRIPAGSFTMGSTPAQTTAAEVPDARARNEHPPVAMRIERPFAIGRYEVTIGEFRAFAEDTGFEPAPGCFGLNGRAWAMDPAATWDAPGYPVDDRYPAACLTAGDYQQYVDWLSEKTGRRYRFPSEAEWEYVAGLGSESPPRSFHRDDADACNLFNAADKQFADNFDGEWPAFACDDGYPITSPTGNFPANKLGMFDVLGNTAEITGDCFVIGHEGRPTDGSARRTQPCGALVFKGGSWAAEPGFLRPAFRVAATPDVRGNGFGLRVVRELDD